MKIIILSFGLVLLLVGCLAQPTQQYTLTVMVATRIPQLVGSMTPSQTSSPAAPPTQIPAATKEATLPRTPIPSPTPNLPATVIAIQQPRLYASYPSPDGKWRTEIIIYDCIKMPGRDEAGGDENAYEKLMIINLASGEEHLADEQLQYCGGVGAFGMEGLFWSPNSRYFYYTTAREGSPDGCGVYWIPPFLRLDVTDLSTTYLGGGPLSPDGTKIATWQWQLQEQINELMVWDINYDKIARLPAYSNIAETGSIAWSPDSQTLAYIQVESICPISGKSYLVLVDLINQEERLLLESESPTFGSVEWKTINELNLFEANGKEWRYDFLTNELTQVP